MKKIVQISSDKAGCNFREGNKQWGFYNKIAAEKITANSKRLFEATEIHMIPKLRTPNGSDYVLEFLDAQGVILTKNISYRDKSSFGGFINYNYGFSISESERNITLDLEDQRWLFSIKPLENFPDEQSKILNKIKGNELFLVYTADKNISPNAIVRATGVDGNLIDFEITENNVTRNVKLDCPVKYYKPEEFYCNSN